MPDSASTSFIALNIWKLPHPGHQVGSMGPSKSPGSATSRPLLQLRVDLFGRKRPAVVAMQPVHGLSQAVFANESFQLAGEVPLDDNRGLRGGEVRANLF